MTTPPKKRWLRLSLRTLLVVVTVLCVVLGWKVRQVCRQKEALAWVAEHNGTVGFDYQKNWLEDSPDIFGTPPGPRWLHELIGVDYFIKPTIVVVSDGDLEDLGPLADLPSLQWLVVESYSPVGDLSPLTNLQELQKLELRCPCVHDLSPLSELKKLQMLRLPMATTDEEMVRLQTILPDCQITIAWQ